MPENYGGLGASFSEGLKKLRSLAKIDGSLGWTVTLCSGENYFIGNLEKQVAQEIFSNPQIPLCFGGSGGVLGTAEKHEDHYKIKGTWRYATGAPYLTHFTLNARITENGKELKEPDGSPLVRSFLIPRKDVHIFEDWDTMGLRASATHSFEVKEAIVHKMYSFHYNQYSLPDPVFRIPFSVFADLTLWVNYIGIAEHFLEEANAVGAKDGLTELAEIILASNQEIDRLSEEVEKAAGKESLFTEAFIQELHENAAVSMRRLSNRIIEAYPLLGVKASRKSHPINQIFRDYFTATQHHIFTKAMKRQ